MACPDLAPPVGVWLGATTSAAERDDGPVRRRIRGRVVNGGEQIRPDGDEPRLLVGGSEADDARVPRSGRREASALDGPDLDERVARIVHELRSPLAATLQAVELLARTPEQPPDPELLAIARRQLQSGLTRVERLLLVLSGGGDPTEAAPRPHELRALVDGILATRPAPVDGPRIEVDVDPALRVTVDHTAFEHVLDNLLANAVRHAPPGSTVRVGASSQPTEVWLEVADGGPGIDPEVVSTVFEPFVRGRNGGAGLGLAIVRQLTEAQGGRVWIDQSTTAGTRVVVALPPA